VIGGVFVELVGKDSVAPLHIGPGFVKVGVTLGFTVTVTCDVEEQLLTGSVTVTVYVVVVVGEALGVAELGLSKLFAGVHE
jgi:hypothetical protein